MLDQYGVEGDFFYVNSASGVSMRTLEATLGGETIDDDGSMPMADLPDHIAGTIVGKAAAKYWIMDEYEKRRVHPCTDRCARQIREKVEPDYWMAKIPRWDPSSLSAAIDDRYAGIVSRSRHLKRGHKKRPQH
ncbi:hypothetical protein [Halomonas sp. CKK8]|uniref:hypothetical protein n=1 Tax=Halomonas sp. CKK8 TaxID=3036127 RepID=UPI002414D303|nr:hypothetical protein [Halomonas sp. CKK8]WFM70991.1 hypothetical protein P8934_16590 [Halomonas sp. CKK8]